MMRSQPLPDAYRGRDDRELAESISAIKKRYGSRLLILGHHYQRPEVVALSDLRGDSFVLSREAASHPEADFIVFCGVHFMAECAAVLCNSNQRVIHPDFEALCPMAAMADPDEVEEAWEQLTALCPGQRIVPVTYVNSRAELKAFCGVRGGVVCTSANARRVFEWARGQGQKVLFFPDEHLGRNTANKLRVPRERIIVWDGERAPRGQRSRGGQGRRGGAVERLLLHPPLFYDRSHREDAPGVPRRKDHRAPGVRGRGGGPGRLPTARPGIWSDTSRRRSRAVLSPSAPRSISSSGWL